LPVTTQIPDQAPKPAVVESLRTNLVNSLSEKCSVAGNSPKWRPNSNRRDMTNFPIQKPNAGSRDRGPGFQLVNRPVGHLCADRRFQGIAKLRAPWRTTGARLTPFDVNELRSISAWSDGVALRLYTRRERICGGV